VTEFKEKSLENTDFVALFLFEQISRDYIEILKALVVPVISSEYNLKLREIRVLMYLEASTDNYMSAAELCEALRQDSATITRSSIILIGEKCLYTTPNLDDSRVKNLYLTEKGAEIAAACRDIFENAISSIQESGEIEPSILEDETMITRLRKFEKRSRLILKLARRNKK